MTAYGSRAYWDERFARDESAFDWLQTWETLKDKIQHLLTPESEILNLGCGTSRLAADLHADGFRFVTSVDFSEVAVALMREKYASLEELEWFVMDALDLQFPSGCFDVVIDKGTLDTILCGEQAFARASLACREVFRMLKPGGVYVAVSYGIPQTRLDYLRTPALSWDVSYVTLPKSTTDAGPGEPGGGGSVHYVYYCVKRTGDALAPRPI